MLARIKRHLVTAVCLLALPTAMTGSQASGAGSFQEGTCELTPVSPCEDCLGFDLAATLGSEGGSPGFLAGATTGHRIVRDRRGRYWVGQDEEINIYEPGGGFVATVGRKGQGPMEFRRASPFHVDPLGHTHVYDSDNMRVSLIREDMSLVREVRLPASNVLEMAALERGYVIQAWMPTADQGGFPMHRLEGDEITRSFGVVPGSDQEPLDLYTAERVLAVDNAGNVVSSHRSDYVIEAWAGDGSRIGRIEGPTLDDGERGPLGPWSWDNPPWHGIRSIRVDAQDRIWVLLHYRRPTGGIARSRGYRRAVMYRLILKAIQRQSFAAGLT